MQKIMMWLIMGFQYIWVLSAIVLVLRAAWYTFDPSIIIDLPSAIIGITIGMVYISGLKKILEPKK